MRERRCAGRCRYADAQRSTERFSEDDATDGAFLRLSHEPRSISQVAGLDAREAGSASGPLGKYDLSFELSEPDAYHRDVPKAEVHVIDAGHFALDTGADQIAQLVRGFMSRGRDGVGGHEFGERFDPAGTYPNESNVRT